MKSEDYIAMDALADSRALSRPLSKKHTIAIMTTVALALGLSLVIPTQYSSINDEFSSESFFSDEHDSSFDPSTPLADAFQTNTQNVVVMQDGKNLDNYDDSIPDAELADSDEEIDNKVRELAESVDKDKVVESKWFVEDVQKGDTISSLFEDLNIPASVTMAILDNKKVAKEVNSLKLGEQISFLIDDNNILQAFVKPLNNKQQLRFFRVKGSANKYDYVIEPISSPIKGGDVVEEVETASVPRNEQKQEVVTASTESKPDQKAENAAKPDQKTTATAPVKPEEKLSPVETRGRLVVVTIKKGDSFSSAVNRAGVTYSEINQILKMFKGRVQFSKNIRQGDTIRILFSAAKGKGKITAVELTLGNKKFASYLNTGDGKYYDENGFNSTKGAFRRFPINGKIVVTSPFNPGRRHPVLGYVRPHNGTDFGVPVGTPIVAPADGVVDKAGYSRGSGYYVVIRHRGGISTVYMHLSKILVKPGQNVQIGKTIARSGNTGLSTGPHLHYEIRINGRPVNAMRVNLGKAADAQVDNTQRKKFTASVQQYKKDLYSNNLMAKK